MAQVALWHMVLDASQTVAFLVIVANKFKFKSNTKMDLKTRLKILSVS